MQINPRQQKAVETVDGPVLVIAGPGTGKTKTLVDRVLYLIAKKGVKADEITVTTFTRKAAAEVATRVSAGLQKMQIADASADLTVGNFHALSRGIIEENLHLTHLKRGFRTIDEVEQQYFILQMLKTYFVVPGFDALFAGRVDRKAAQHGDAKARTRAAQEIQNLVNDIREKCLVRELEVRAARSVSPLQVEMIRAAMEIFSIYQTDLQARNSIDYSGILSLAVDILERNPEALAAAQRRAKYLMVDEHQDTNAVQDRLIELLSQKTKNLFVVGDDDQSLYRFRGAEVSHFLNFAKRHPGAETIELDRNYRSDGRILRFAENFIDAAEDRSGKPLDFTSERYAKHLQPANLENDHENAVLQILAQDTDAWIAEILSLLQDLRSRGVAYHQIAFLSASLNQPHIGKLKTALRQKGIGIYTPKDASVMSQPVVKLFFGVYAWVFAQELNARDQDGVKSYTREALTKLSDQAIQEIKEVVSHIQDEMEMRGIQPIEIAHRLLALPVLKRHFVRALGDETVKNGKFIARAMSLIESFSYQFDVHTITAQNKQQFVDDFFFDYLEVLRNHKIKEDDDTVIPPENTVSMMTIHQSKGMEYPVVIVIGLQSGPYYPFRGQIAPVDRLHLELGETLADETRGASLDFYRKMYTAFTRAKNLLVLAGMQTGYRTQNDKIFARPLAEVQHYVGEQSLDGLVFGKVADVALPQSYAFTTHIEVYESCPLQYFFLREQGIPSAKTIHMQYGTLVHTSIDEFHQRLLHDKVGHAVDSTPQTDTQKISADAQALEMPAIPETAQTQELLEISAIVAEIAQGLSRNGAALEPEDIHRATAEVQDYVQAEREGLLAGLVAAEASMQRTEAGYILRGQIDMIARRPDKSYEIVDFKTGMPPDENGNHTKKDTYREQLLTYRELLEKSKGVKVSRLALYFTDPSASQHLWEVPGDDVALADRMRRTDATVAAIEARKFDTQTMDLKKCRYCPMRFYCGREV